MPATELAHFLLKPPYHPSHPSLISALTTAKTVLERASGCNFHFFSVSPHASEASEIYILGHWQSVTAHQTFLPSEGNQELLKLVEGLLDVEWMFHLEDQKVFGTENGDEVKEVLDDLANNEEGMKLVRVFQEEGGATGEKRADLEERVANLYDLERSDTRKWPVVVGYRVERQNEAVVLSPNIEPNNGFDSLDGARVIRLWRIPLGK